MTDYLPIGSIIISLICLVLTIFLWKKIEKKTFNILDSLDSELKTGLESVSEQLDPIIKANSRAMGAISSLSDDTKMDKALERRIGQDLLGQYDDVLEIVRMTFPNVSAYIDEHPEAVTKLMPRLNSLISDPEARKRLSLGGGIKSDLSRIWKESDR